MADPDLVKELLADKPRPTQKRLCVFYRHAKRWEKKNVQWIVCKECQIKIRRGALVGLLFKAAAEAKIAECMYDQS